jgi:hypothetical protein
VENVQDGLMINIMKTKICLILTCLILSSCATQKRCYRKFPQVASHDSVYIEKLKEVPIYVPGDTVNVEVPADCPDQELVTIENEKLKYELVIEKGKVKTKYVIKPDTVKVYVPEIHEKIVIEKKPVEIRYIPPFIKTLAWIGGSSILLLAVLFGLKMRNKGILKIFK